MSLYTWRLSKLQQHGVDKFYYLAFINNLDSILSRGILPKNIVSSLGIPYDSFAEEGVQRRRHQRDITLSDGSTVTIHDVVPLYLTTKTPTLYARKDIQHELFFIDISLNAICDENHEIAFSDGNAGASDTKFYGKLYMLENINWDVINAEYWTNFEDGRRKRCSEFLVYPEIEPDKFERIVVLTPKGQIQCQEIVENKNIDIPVDIDRDYFF